MRTVVITQLQTVEITFVDPFDRVFGNKGYSYESGGFTGNVYHNSLDGRYYVAIQVIGFDRIKFYHNIKVQFLGIWLEFKRIFNGRKE